MVSVVQWLSQGINEVIFDQFEFNATGPKFLTEVILEKCGNKQKRARDRQKKPKKYHFICFRLLNIFYPHKIQKIPVLPKVISPAETWLPISDVALPSPAYHLLPAAATTVAYNPPASGGAVCILHLRETQFQCYQCPVNYEKLTRSQN